MPCSHLVQACTVTFGSHNPNNCLVSDMYTRFIANDSCINLHHTTTCMPPGSKLTRRFTETAKACTVRAAAKMQNVNDAYNLLRHFKYKCSTGSDGVVVMSISCLCSGGHTLHASRR